MFNNKSLFCCVIIINCVLLIFAESEQNVNFHNVNDLVDMEEMMLRKKLFNDLDELKSSMKDISLRYEECREINESKNKELPMFDIRFDELPEKCKTQNIPKNCAEATSCTHRSGIYKIMIEKYSNDSFLVECDAKTEDGDWIIIQRRQDGSVDFYRDWFEYQKGFGNIGGEYFIGLDKLYALTNYQGYQELLVVMEDYELNSKYAKYNTFVIGNATEMYALQQLGKYSGNAGDSLYDHLGMKFSTKDQENDKDVRRNCAQLYNGAWWYKMCHISNLNGKYGEQNSGKGLVWKSFRGSTAYSLKYVKMMIRRRRI